jgi:hypothetical protein
MRRAARPWLASLLVTSLLGCARSAVPSLDPESLTAPALPGLSPRAIDVRVVDQRPVPQQARVATERVVADALERVLATRGVAVESEAEHQLFITASALARSDPGLLARNDPAGVTMPES